MPVTFLAHQAPVLPVARRWPHAFDGLALVIGSMAPDLAYVADDTRWAIDAHAWPAMLTFGVPVTIAVAWIAARVLAPVVPTHLPDAGTFHVHDYRGLARHRFGWVRTPLGAALGALSHIALDSLTHRRGWPARHLDWYARPIGDGTIFDRPWTPDRIAQYAGHVVLSALTLWLLWRSGRDRWMAAAAAHVPVRRTVASAVLLWGGTVAGAALAAAGTAIAEGPATEDFAPDVVRIALGAFAGLVAGSLAVRWRWGRAPAAP